MAATMASVDPLDPGAQPLRGRRAQRAPCRHWLSLFSFGLNSAFNAFMCMNLVVVSDLAQRVLHSSESGIALTYSGMLITVFAGMPVGLALVVWWEGAGLCLGVTMNALCAVVRWWGVRRRNYAYCFASAILSGIGAWTILPMPAQLSEQRFPPEKWTLTTSLAVQANYFGWMLGSIVVPQVAHNRQSFEDVLLYQAAFSAVVFVVFVACYRPVDARDVAQGRSSREAVSSASVLSGLGAERPAGTGSVRDGPLAEGFGAGGDGPGAGTYFFGGVRIFASVVRAYPSLGMQIAAYGILGGVGFVVPGCNDAIFSHMGFESAVSSYFNIAFIGSGVLCGLALGYSCKNPLYYGVVLKTNFVLATASLTAMAVFVKVVHPTPGNAQHLAVILALTIVAGMTTVGFIGIGIEAAALYPAGSTYVCFFVEWVVQLVGGVFSQLASNKDGFVIMAAVCWFALILLLVGHRQPRVENPHGGS